MKAIWEKPLAELNTSEWEQLCDGCGQCCLIKLQDDKTEEILATDVVCRFHDCESGRCRVYASRMHKQPSCFVIDRHNPEHFGWLPKTCAYRLRYEGKPLFDWHPLISGSRQAMVEAQIAIADWCISEHGVDEKELPERVIFSLNSKD